MMKTLPRVFGPAAENPKYAVAVWFGALSIPLENT
jgi:hypothetical protein